MRGHNVVGTLPYAHPQHIKVLKHIVYTIWMWDAVYGALEGQQIVKTIRKSTKNAF